MIQFDPTSLINLNFFVLNRHLFIIIIYSLIHVFFHFFLFIYNQDLNYISDFTVPLFKIKIRLFIFINLNF